MSRPARHLSPDDPEPRIDFFTGISFAVDQLAIDHEGLRSQLALLRKAHSERDAVGVKLSAEAASRLLGQMQGLANVLARVAVEHLNRRPRA